MSFSDGPTKECYPGDGHKDSLEREQMANPFDREPVNRLVAHHSYRHGMAIR